jgi:hypothetical protein
LWFGILFVFSLVVLGVELISILPDALVRWQPFDYHLYIEMGQAVRAGVNPYGAHHYWPFATMLWIFAPLSLLPDWFRFVWILAPFISLLILFRKQGVLLFFFVPLWFVVSDAMIDGWLLLPLALLLSNRPGWAGLGGAIVLFKPQLAFLAVAYALAQWLIARDWKNLASLLGALVLFYAPTFFINPNWIGQMLAVLPERAEQTTTLLPLFGGSLWAWWALGGLGNLICIVLFAATIGLAFRALPFPSKRVATFLLLGLALDPILFGSNQIMALPALARRAELVSIVLVSWAAFALDKLIGGFGGGYALIPIVALYWQTRQQAA